MPKRKGGYLKVSDKPVVPSPKVDALVKPLAGPNNIASLPKPSIDIPKLSKPAKIQPRKPRI